MTLGVVGGGFVKEAQRLGAPAADALGERVERGTLGTRRNPLIAGALLAAALLRRLAAADAAATGEP